MTIFLTRHFSTGETHKLRQRKPDKETKSRIKSKCPGQCCGISFLALCLLGCCLLLRNEPLWPAWKHGFQGIREGQDQVFHVCQTGNSSCNLIAPLEAPASNLFPSPCHKCHHVASQTPLTRTAPAGHWDLSRPHIHRSAGSALVLHSSQRPK